MGWGNVPERHRSALAERHAKEEAFERQARKQEEELVNDYADANPGFIFEGGMFTSFKKAVFNRDDHTETIVKTKRQFGRRDQPVVKTYHDGELVEEVVACRENSRPYKSVKDWAGQSSPENRRVITPTEDEGHQYKTADRYFKVKSEGSVDTIALYKGEPKVKSESPSDGFVDPGYDITDPYETDSDSESSEQGSSHEDVERPDAKPVKNPDPSDLEGLAKDVYLSLCEASDEMDTAPSEADISRVYFEMFDGDATREGISSALTDVLMKGKAYELDEDAYAPI